MRTGTRRLVPTLVGVTLLTTFLPLAAPRPVAAAAPTELFFSEYIEGSSNNNALEIYNGTGAPVVLDAGSYNIQMFFNGSAAAGLTLNLAGTLVNGDVFVYAQASASATILAQADATSSAGWFNGDDAVVLRHGTTVIDAIGQVGVDPGTEWGTGLTSTADNTLRRKADVCAGDTNGTDAFDPATEWDGFAIDTFDGLGTHTIDGGGPVDAPAVLTCGAPLVTSAGVVVGCVLALLGGYWLSTRYEVDRLDLYYLVGGVAGLWLVGQLAAWQPSLRAAKVSPAMATRTV